MKSNNIYSLIKTVMLLLFLLPFSTVLSVENSPEFCDSLLKLGVEEIGNKNYSKSLEYFSEAKSVAEKNNFNKQLFLAINNIGIIHSELLDYGTALDYFLNAYKITLKGLDKHYELMAMLNIGVMYEKDGDSEKAIKYMLDVYNDAKKYDDLNLRGISATNIAIIYNKTGKAKLAGKYIDDALALLKDDERALPHIKVAEVEYTFLNDEPAKAKQLACQLIDEFQDAKHKEHRVATCILLSKIHCKENKLHDATNYINLALNENPDIKDKIDLYTQLSSLYFEQGHYNKAFLYKDSVIIASDSLNKMTNGLHFENNRIKFEMENYQKDLQYSKERLLKERTLFVLLLFIAIILIWAIYNNAIKEKQRKIIAEANEKILSLELEQEIIEKTSLEKQLVEKESFALSEKKRFDDEQELLKQEIELKNRKLVTKAMYLSSKNNLINDLYNSIKDLPENTKKRDLIKNIGKLRKQFETESDWKNYLLYFEDVNQNFINSLREKHPNLSSNDIRFLSYIYIGLNTKEISSLLNITVDSCKKKKMRVCKKLNLSEGSSSLYGYLSGL